MEINERIVAMQDRVAAKTRAVQEQEAQAKLEKDRDKKALEGLQKAMWKAFNPLRSLPLRPSGYVDFDMASGSVSIIRCFRDPLSHAVNRNTLITFRLYVDSGLAWIEHEDTKISLDVALDLAVETIETRLDA